MKHLTGFTLIELMVTIAVVVILMAMGVPALQQYATTNRAVAQLNRISGDLSLARSEAIKRGTHATVCASSNSTANNPTCSGANQWEDGWIAFADLDNDGDFNNNDVLIAVAEQLPGGLTLRTTQLDEEPERIRFRADGTLVDVDNDGDTDGTFVVCNSQGEQTKARALNISNLGRNSIATDPDDNGIVNDVTNSDVTCP